MKLELSQGTWTVIGGTKHPGKTLDQIAEQDPGFLQFLRATFGPKMEDDPYYALEDVMRNHNILLERPKKKKGKNEIRKGKDGRHK